MSDLSRLLEDVYRSSVPTPDAHEPASEDATATATTDVDVDAGSDSRPTMPFAPAWSAPEVMEEVFGDWVPGPGAEASSTERAMFEELADLTDLAGDEPRAIVIDADADADAVASMLAALGAGPSPVPAAAPLPVAPVRWSRAEDDILPVRSSRHRLRLRLR